MKQLLRVLRDPHRDPVLGATAACSRGGRPPFGTDPVGSALRRSRRAFWSAGLLDAVEPIALLPVPGGWRLLATYGETGIASAIRLLTLANFPLGCFAGDVGMLECALAPRAQACADSPLPDAPPRQVRTAGPWVHATTLFGESYCGPALRGTPMDPQSWLRRLPVVLDDLVNAEGLVPWAPGQPEVLAWCSPGAQPLYEGRLPGKTLASAPHRLIGLWDAGPELGSRCFHLLELAQGHGVFVRVPFHPVVPEQVPRAARPVRTMVHLAVRWQKFARRFEASRLAIELRNPTRWGRGARMTGRIQAAVALAGGVEHRKVIDLPSPSAPWWNELTRWARGLPGAQHGRPRVA